MNKKISSLTERFYDQYILTEYPELVNFFKLVFQYLEENNNIFDLILNFINRFSNIDTLRNSTDTIDLQIKDLNDCIITHNKLRLNCLKMEEENKEWCLALDYCKQNTKNLIGKIELKDEIIINKDKIIINKNKEIGIEIEKRNNVEKAMKKTIVAMKKKNFFGHIIRIGVAFVAGIGIAQLL